jgi:hypothetical protein
VRGQGFPESLTSPQKLWIPLHVPLNPPFIGRWRDFYILRLSSNIKNILSVNMYKNVFYPVICGTIFTYLQASHQFTPWTQTFEATPLTWSSLDLRPFIHENHQSLRSPNWVPESTTEVKSFKISEVSIFTILRTRQVSTVLKWVADLQSNAYSVIISHIIRGSANHVRNNKTPFQTFLRYGTDLWPSYSSLNTFTNSPKFQSLRSSEGERFLPNSPTLAPRGSGLTLTIRFREQFSKFL